MKILLCTAICLWGMVSGLVAQTVHLTRPSSSQNPGSESDSTLLVADALALYGKLTGTQVLTDNTVQGAISLPKLDGLADEKKIELIEKAIFLYGFILFDAGDHVVSVLGIGRSPRTSGVPVYTTPEEIPVRERVFTYAVKLEHRDPNQLAGMFQQYIPPVNATAFTPDQESHILLVTGTTSIVRRVLKLIPLLDVPMDAAGTTGEKPPLKPADTPRASGGS